MDNLHEGINSEAVNQSPPNPNGPWYKRRHFQIGGVAVAALGAALLVAGVNANKGGEERPGSNAATTEDASPTPRATETAVPTRTAIPSPSAPETETTTPTPEGFDASAGLIAEQFPTPESLAEVISQAETKWINEGATPENKDIAFTQAGGGADVYAETLAEENKRTYAAALYGKDWEDNPGIVNFVDRMAQLNRDTLMFYFLSSEVFGVKNPGDTVPYSMTRTFTGTISNYGDYGNSYELSFYQVSGDNSASNTVGERLTFAEGPVDTSEYQETIRYEVDGDGTIVITEINRRELNG